MISSLDRGFETIFSRTSSSAHDWSLLESDSYSASKRTFEKVVNSGTSHLWSGIPSDSLGIGIRVSTLDFINSSDSAAGMVSRCSSLILRELSGSSMDKTGSSGVIAENGGSPEIILSFQESDLSSSSSSS
nr:hypothetical protein [Tanacetum cinerariifolium]